VNKKIDNLEEMVEKISKRVAEKLKNKTTGTEQTGRKGTTWGLSSFQHNKANKNFDHFKGKKPEPKDEGPETVDVDLASIIDHTLLLPDASREQLIKVCTEAKEYHFCTVCVNSSNIALVAKELAGSTVKPIAVVGFPLGAATTESKVFEAKEAIQNGAKEIDMVVNIGLLKSKDYQGVFYDILAVVEASRPYPVKVILETSTLTRDEKVISCALSKAANAAFVKTSTGFNKGGATVEDIKLMREIVGPQMGVKASGGVRTRADAVAMVNAGASRIGASSSIAIVTGKNASKGNY
jgi:deoxyribose-phosphate aldolase